MKEPSKQEKKPPVTKAVRAATKKHSKTDIFDYLEWRGDLPFGASPFCEIDSLILSEICFIDWGDAVPDDVKETPVTLKDAADRFFEGRVPEQMQMGAIVPQLIPLFVRKAADTVRFGRMEVVGDVNIIDLEKEMQFSATVYFPDDGTVFVAYRGTDDTIVGWKEDMNLSFMEAVPAQKEAVRYLEEVADAYPDRLLRIGGHSKGGNLAVYAGSHARPDVQDRILGVYNNDGPGFEENFFKEEGFLRIADRLINVYPESSIVGMLFEHSEREIIVKSSATGLNQHDGFSWQIVGPRFRTCENFSADSIRTRKAVSEWMKGISEEDRETFCGIIYSLFNDPQVQTLTDLNARKITLVRSYAKLPPEGRRIVRTILGKLLDEGWNVLTEGILPKKAKKGTVKKVKEEKSKE